MIDLEQAVAVALEAARRAVKVHQQYLGTVQADEWSEKGAADFVTHVDREAEARIIATVRKSYPDHAVLAEEAASEGNRPELADYLWVVDPLDGTTNFLHGYPMYCASVALLHRGIPVAGAVASLPTSEEWTAYQGGGAFRNGVRISVSECSRFDRALIGTGFPFKARDVVAAYVRQFHSVLERVSDIRRGGAAALDLCHVAAGFLDGFWELDLRPWDYAAGALMIREAGGVISGVHTDEPDYDVGGGIIAGNPHVYAELRGLVS